MIHLKMYGFEQTMCALQIFQVCGLKLSAAINYVEIEGYVYTIQFENDTLGNVIINISVSYKDNNFCLNTLDSCIKL